MYELNPGMLFTESFIKIVGDTRRNKGQGKERKQKHLSRYFPEKKEIIAFLSRKEYISL